MGEFQRALGRIPALPSAADFGREVCGDIAAAEAREWLVANGIGGFACGTVAGNVTRRYHGLLVAALDPPVGRTLLVSNIDATAEYLDDHVPLTPQRWWNAGRASVATEGGHKHIESFRLEGTTPVWTFALADALLEKRVWMQPGENTTYVVYTLLRASAPLRLALKALINYRDYHSSTHAVDWWMKVDPVARGLRVTAYDGATPFYLLSTRAAGEPAHDWYRNFDLPAERERGLDDHEDHLHAASFRATLSAGESAALVLSTRADPQLDATAAYLENVGRQKDLLDHWQKANGPQAATAPDWIRQLVLAADQFIAVRPLADDPGAKTVLAGFPWFTDWGRDTMIALPGLTLSTGRPEIARSILRTFARFVNGGMLPNYFPDAGTPPEYNTVDATLWFFEATRQYYAATRDLEFLRDIFPVLEDIAEHHRRGTRHQIHVDASDGLLYAGEAGVQLTWMDARVGDRVITPRIGKPVEINALWHSALDTLAEFAVALGREAAGWNARAEQVRASFQKFWNAGTGCCFDVIDGPQGNEPAVRPNQIFAVSLPRSPLNSQQQAAVVEVCARRLLTSFGLCSLAPGEPGYHGRYLGGPAERDGAYHQGTVWGWLLGHWALAQYRVTGDAVAAQALLAPIEAHLRDAGLGQISEIFDGDPPHTPRGCPAQAWSVACVLEAWWKLERAKRATAPSARRRLRARRRS